jgi:hypothetical protein
MHSEARPILLRALDLLERERGPAHQATLACLSELGLLQVQSGELDAAEVSLKRAIAGQRALLGDDASATLASMATLASVEVARGNLSSAEAVLVDVLGRLERAGTAADPPSCSSRYSTTWRSYSCDEADLRKQNPTRVGPWN